jgi:hypothetical protein
MSRSLPIQHAETFHRERDGVEFAIRVIQADGALWGHWACLSCGRRGQSGHMQTEVERAAHSASDRVDLRQRPPGRSGLQPVRPWSGPVRSGPSAAHLVLRLYRSSQA